MQLIFVTGLPRSGTTWAGFAIARATRSLMVHEPFNFRWHPERAGFHMRYYPPGSPRDRELVGIIRRELAPKKKPWRRLKALLLRRVVVRDVLACLAVEHIWENFRPRVLLMARHPCAVAASWNGLGFEVRSRIENLLAQEQLVADHLGPFEGHLRSSVDFYHAIGAYWGAAYYTLHRIAARHPDWLWTTHETLCLAPEARFREALTAWELQAGPGLQDFLAAHDRDPAPGESPFSVARKTRAEPEKWKQLLDREQVLAVMAGAEPFGVFETLYP